MTHRPSPKATPRHPIGAPVYKTSLTSLPEQALLHRICAELLSSSNEQRVVVLPQRRLHPNTPTKDGQDDLSRTTSWVRPDQVLEILNGALCIVDDPALRSDSSSAVSSLLSYKQKHHSAYHAAYQLTKGRAKGHLASV